ncbi:MAG: DUF2199 domain-containing protein [Gemmatales bacterium]
MPSYHCKQCGMPHDGIPAFHADRPTSYWDVPEEKRSTDVFLTSDSCVIAEQFYFIRGCLEIPIRDHPDVFTWGVWVSLKEENFFKWQDCYSVDHRSHIGPFFGWLCTQLPIYPDTLHLKTMVHLRDNGIRPFIELEATDHPLAIDQQKGISLERALELVHQLPE